MRAGCQGVRPTSRSFLLPNLPWPASDAAHRDAFEETAVAPGVLDGHQRGVARRDAAPVIEGLGAAESPAQTARTLIGCAPTRTRTAAKPCGRRDRAQLCFTANQWFYHGSLL